MLTGSFFSLVLLMSALIVLPGCGALDWLKDKMSCTSAGCSHDAGKHGGEAVISFDDKPAMTAEQFDKRVEMIYQSKPGLKEYISQMPEEKQIEIFEQMADGLGAELLIVDYVEKNKIGKGKDQDELAKEAHRQLDCELAIRNFQEYLTKEIQEVMNKISDEEASKYYQDNREKLPIFQQAPFVTKPAAVKAKGFVATTKGEADKLASQIKSAISFDKVAADAKKTASVTNYDAAKVEDAALKAGLNAIKSVGVAEVIKDSKGRYIVVVATAKEAPAFADFAAVKDVVKQVMVQETHPNFYLERINALKKECKVNVNKDALKKYVTHREAPAAAQEANAAAPATEAPVAESKAPSAAAPEKAKAV